MKRVKRLAAAVLAAGIISASPAWAAEVTISPALPGKIGSTVQDPAGVILNQPQKIALEKVCQILPELKDLSVRQRHDYEGEPFWRLSLTDSPQGLIPGIDNISAHLTFDKEKGELTALEIQNPKWASEEIPPPVLAKEKAEEFARRLLGDRIKYYQPAADMGYGGGSTRDSKGNRIVWASAAVQFNRLVNGIPLLNSGFQVSVDAAGRVTGYHKTDSDNIEFTKFPDPSRAVNKEAAEKNYAGLVKMKLNYLAHQPVKQLTFGKGRNETRPVLIYSPSFQGPLDALTGQFPGDFRGNLPQTEKITLIGEGKRFIVNTPEEAVKLIADEFGLDLSGMKSAGAEIREELPASGNRVKEYYWRAEADPGPDGKPVKMMRFAHLTTLADTGQLVGFNLRDDSGAGREGAFSQETARKTAVQFLQKFLPVGEAQFEIWVPSANEDWIPAWVDKGKLEANYSRPPQMYFHFNLTHQGVPVTDRYYSVTVDLLTGKIVSFYDGSGSPAVILPNSKGIVSADMAKAEYLRRHPLRLTYIWPEYFGQKAPAPYLVYLPASGTGWEYIDAFSGKTVAPEEILFEQPTQ